MTPSWSVIFLDEIYDIKQNSDTKKLYLANVSWLYILFLYKNMSETRNFNANIQYCVQKVLFHFMFPSWSVIWGG